MMAEFSIAMTAIILLLFILVIIRARSKAEERFNIILEVGRLLYEADKLESERKERMKFSYWRC